MCTGEGNVKPPPFSVAMPSSSDVEVANKTSVNLDITPKARGDELWLTDFVEIRVEEQGALGYPICHYVESSVPKKNIKPRVHIYTT